MGRRLEGRKIQRRGGRGLKTLTIKNDDTKETGDCRASYTGKHAKKGDEGRMS